MCPCDRHPTGKHRKNQAQANQHRDQSTGKFMLHERDTPLTIDRLGAVLPGGQNGSPSIHTIITDETRIGQELKFTRSTQRPMIITFCPIIGSRRHPVDSTMSESVPMAATSPLLCRNGSDKKIVIKCGDILSRMSK